MADNAPEEVLEPTIEEIEDQETPAVEGEPEPQEAQVEIQEEPEIPVRSTASYIIARQTRQIEELRSKLNDKEDQPADPISDPVMERIDHLEKIALGQSDDRELHTLFQDNPDAKQYEKRIRAYMEHDAYKGVAPEVIYHHLSYNDARAQKDSKRKIADLEAGQTKTVGSSVRETRSSNRKTAEDIRNMTDEEFLAYDQEQLRKAGN